MIARPKILHELPIISWKDADDDGVAKTKAPDVRIHLWYCLYSHALGLYRVKGSMMLTMLTRRNQLYQREYVYSEVHFHLQQLSESERFRVITLLETTTSAPKRICWVPPLIPMVWPPHASNPFHPSSAEQRIELTPSTLTENWASPDSGEIQIKHV